MSRAARWGPGRKLLLQLALLPLLVGLVELGYRGWTALGGHPYDPDEVAARLYAAAEQVEKPLVAFNAGREDDDSPFDLSARRIPSPYYGWDYENRFPYLVNKAKAFTLPKAQETYDILVLGGSVAAGFAAYGSDRLIELLATDPRFEGRRIEIIGGAHGGYKQLQQLNMLVYLLGLGWRPDAVINLDGFNEVAIGNQNADAGAHPLYPSVDHWGHLLVLGRAGEDQLDALSELRRAQRGPRRVADLFVGRGLLRSALLGHLALERSRAARWRYTQASGAYTAALVAKGSSSGLFGPSIPPTESAAEDPAGTAVEVVAEGWASASRSMQAICDDLGILYLHVLQPTLHDRGSKPLTPQEVRTGKAGPGWVTGVQAGYPLLRARGAELRAEGVDFVDGSMVFAEVREPLYVDACHYGPQGDELLAELVAERFLAALP